MTINGEVPKWDMQKLEFFSPAKLAFIEELKLHPLLIAKIQSETVVGDFGEAIGKVATYCNMGMDGMYSEEDFESLYPVFLFKMRAMRKVRLH